MSNGGAGGDKDGKDSGGDDQKLKIGEKEYSASDVENLVKEVSSNAGKVQQLQKVLDAAERFDMTPEEFAQQGVGAFQVVNNLIDKGIIDERGNLVEKKVTESGLDDPEGKLKQGLKDLGLEGLLDLDDPGIKAKLKKQSLGDEAVKAINDSLSSLTRSIEGIKNIQAGMIRENYEGKITGRFPNLDSDDVAKVFRIATADKTKDIWQHAEALSKVKLENETLVAKAFAEKHGLDYEAIMKAQDDANKLKEHGPGGGSVAQSLIAGKKISFDAKQKGEGYVTPLDAARAFLKKQQEG